jgi:hypothetical protein
MVSLSIGDVETRHSSNLAFCSGAGATSFTQVVANFINREGHFISRCSRAEAALLSKAGLLPEHESITAETKCKLKQALEDSSGPGGLFHIDTNSCPTRDGPSTPLHLFMKDFKQQEAAAGCKLPRIGKELWDILRAEFHKLTDRRKHQYQQQSEHASSLRRIRSEVKRQSSSQSRSSEPSDDPHNDDAATGGSQLESANCSPNAAVTVMDMSVLASKPLGAGDCLNDLRLDICKGQMVAAADSADKNNLSSSHLILDRDVASLPVTAQQLEDAERQARTAGLTRHAQCKKFAAGVQSIAGPSGQDDVFPETVNYRGHCGQFCRLVCHHEAASLAKRFSDTLNAMMKACGSPSDAAMADMVLGITIRGSETQFDRCDRFFLVTALSSQSGTHKPDQVFVQLECVTSRPEYPYQGCLLRFKLVDPITQDLRLKAPMDRGNGCGRFCLFTADELTKLVLYQALPQQSDCARLPMDIRISQLDYSDESLSVIRTLGLKSDKTWLLHRASSSQAVAENASQVAGMTATGKAKASLVAKCFGFCCSTKSGNLPVNQFIDQTARGGGGQPTNQPAD